MSDADDRTRSAHNADRPDADRAEEPSPGAIDRMARPARGALASLSGGLGRVGHAVDVVEQRLAERAGARVRRVRRQAAAPLPNLNHVYPEVARTRPIQVGLRTIPVEEIAGTAVGGGDQRGGDFLPLRPFRGRNWANRWQRLNRAQDALAILPPIEVVKHGGRYWVVDGHNRVALALYSGQPEIDASIVELVAPGQRRTEPVVTLAPTLTGSRALRTTGAGRRSSQVLDDEERTSSDSTPDEP
jgi:hypothetical protein